MKRELSPGARAWRRPGTRIAVALAGAGLAALAFYQLSDPSAPVRADRDAHARAAQGSGLDPLSDQEIQKAQRAALADQPRAQGVTGRPQVAFVSASRLEGPDGGPRVADVRLYDYRTDEMIVRHVDLASSQVIKTERATGTQPIASVDELRRAVELILADRRLGPGLRTSYKGAAGHEPASASDIHTRGHIFRAPQAAGARNAAAVAQCGAKRCFTVDLQLPNGTWMDTGRIVVDMSAQRVVILDR
ncbi:hypothetical protein AGRA3207_002266 [Actinomadura graeca]|uniref:Tat pathway signal sequence domain protein n=1 Tax=Actinomadura graeca TaxID=2750812 RepID=A0ABX8QRI6_9ACTN|nr:hypothetical protein [Actinomadura graeca]QXJ21415.1 hypothetical protein AGRA3207_002266 [Actinomadura graeca]